MAAESGTNGSASPKRIIMWCVPRSVSTAVTKCMSFVDGAEVWFESYILAKLADDMYANRHPVVGASGLPNELEGNEELFREAAREYQMGGDLEEYNLELLTFAGLKRTFDSLDPSMKFVFVKDMGFGMPPSRYPYLPDKSSGFTHFFLIRNPVKVYKSLRKALLAAMSANPNAPKQDPDTFDVFSAMPEPRKGTRYYFQAIHQLWTHIRKTVDYEPVIVDIDDLLENPASMLPRLCGAIGIPYKDSLLTWDESADVALKWRSMCPNVRDAPSYSMFFTGAFKSTCFKASATTATLEDATDDVKKAAEKEMPYYNEMHALRIK